MSNKIIPLSVPNLSLDILENIKETIETGWVSTGGKFIEKFEKQVADYVGVEKAVSVQSGTSGLHLALDVLGIKENDEVIVPTLTFIAAVNPVKYINAEPIFMDCDDNLNIDVDKILEFLENECFYEGNKIINKKTNRQIKAIIIVHVFGNPVNMEKLMKIKEKYDLKIIEDATESLGSYYKEGKYKNKYCGTIGDIGIYSFNANKIITTGGGGMVVSNDLEILEKISFLSRQAKTDSLYFVHDEIGYNYRMLNIQAAFGTSQMEKIEGFIDIKIKNYNNYKKEIDKIDGLKLLPFRKDTRANHWFYSILVDEEKYGIDRNTLLDKFTKENIQTRPIWKLIHTQKPYFNNETYKIEKADFYVKNIINIPCSTNLTEEDIKKVIGYLIKWKKY